MAKLFEYTLEQSSFNDHASCVVCYYDEVPTRDQIIANLQVRKGKLTLSCDTEDPYFSYDEVPTKVSKRAKLLRYECHPCG